VAAFIILHHVRRFEHDMVTRPSELVPEPCRRHNVHDRLEPEPPWLFEEEVATRRTITPEPEAIGSHLALVVDLKEGGLAPFAVTDARNYSASSGVTSRLTCGPSARAG
jgi:hypothetical protein